MIAELFSSVWVWLLIAGLSGSYLLFTRQRSPLPIINDYPGDFLRIKAYKAYFKDPKKLLADGFAKFKGPFMVLVPWGSKIVLPNSLSDWVKLNRDLDHQELVREEYFARYSGFEASYAIHSPDRMLIEVLRTKLSQNEGASVLPTVSRHVALALEEHWGNDGDSWNTINWEKDTTGLISYAAASVFIGPEMATNPKWQRITQTYVRDVFAAVGMLQMYPRTLRPIVHQFLPQSSSCRALVREARAVVGKVIEKRAQEAAVAAAQGQEPPHHNDALAWMQKAQPEFNNTLDLADLQLGLAMAALFTTAEALRQVLIDVAQHPELVDPLRQEISGALSNHGIGQTALNEMELLDSVMKESQRLFPLLLSLERHAVRDVTLPDGTKIPKGSQILVDSSDMWNPKVYEDPDSYDGYRFLKRRQAGDKSAQYVQSSLEHQVFGRGRHICPGRFFATNELKLCLAHILTKYDIRLKQGYEPRPMQFGFFAIVDPGVQLEVRRREKGSADTML